MHVLSFDHHFHVTPTAVCFVMQAGLIPSHLGKQCREIQEEAHGAAHLQNQGGSFEFFE